MDDVPHVDAALAAKLAQKIVELLAPEDAGTRRRAVSAALTLLGEPPVSQNGRLAPHQPSSQHSGEEELISEFFHRDEKLSPADNTHLCAAYHFAQYGSVGFTLNELKEIGKEAGLVLPDRIDMTIKGAGKKGKSYFQLVGKSTYKPTAIGAMYFSERWSVKPGKQRKQPSE